MAGLPTYGSNLVAMKDLVSLSMPAKAFVEAAVGVRNEALERLYVKASLMNSDARRSALRSHVTERRPFTAAVAGSEQSSAANSRRCAAFYLHLKQPWPNRDPFGPTYSKSGHNGFSSSITIT